MRRVLERFLSKVDKPVQCFHGTGNAAYLEDEIPDSLRKTATLVELPIAALSSGTYNALVLSEAFWDALTGRREILCFQTEAMTCGVSRFWIEAVMDFDYIGSFWPRNRPFSTILDGGSGGLSLRDWAASVDCLQRFPAEGWKGGRGHVFRLPHGYRRLQGGPRGGLRALRHPGFLPRTQLGRAPADENEALMRRRFFSYCPEARCLER